MSRVGSKPFVFISAVSNEFDTVRDELRSDISSPHAAAHVRSDFVPNDDPTLVKLEKYIQESSIVIHIVGQQSGKIVPQTEIESFCSSRPRFCMEMDPSADYRSGRKAITYTQFEGMLAIFLRKILILCALGSFEGDQTDTVEDAQIEHFRRLRDDFHYEFLFFNSPEQLRIQILRTTSISLLRNGKLHELRSAKILQKTDISGPVEARPEEEILLSRRRSPEKRTSWQSVFRSEYYRREELLSDVIVDIEEFLGRTDSKRKEKLNVFCISGRSGDGKSTLLWQVARDLLGSGKVTEVYTIPDVSCFEDALTEIATRPNPGPIFIDDIHRLMHIDSDPDGQPNSLSDGFAALLDKDVSFPPIISCGPTPELKSFSARNRNLFEVQNYEIPSLSDRDRRCLSEWLGLDLSDESKTDDLLVVFLFELLEGESINDFAQRFSRRLANQGALEAAKCVVAASVFDVPVDQKILSYFEGGSFLERLTEVDQRHFSMGGSTASGQAGVAFSHPQVSVRLFSEWTTDTDLGGSVAKELGQHIAPAFIVSHDDLIQCRALANSAAFHFVHSDLMEVDLNEATNFLIASTQQLRDYPDASALIASALLRSINRTKHPALTEGLVRVSANLCHHPKVDGARRIEVAAPLLGLVEKTNLEGGEDIEAWVFDLLFGASASGSSATAILFLCANLPKRSNFWISWGLFWLYLNPVDPKAAGLVTWLIANKNYHPNRCRQIIEEFFQHASSELKNTIAGRVIQTAAVEAYSNDRWLKKWFEANAVIRSVEPALRVLARNGDYSTLEWLGSVCEKWMESNAGSTAACDIMSTLLDNKSSRTRYLPKVHQFVLDNKELPSIDDTIMSYLKAAAGTKLLDSALDLAVDWVESRQMDDRTSKLVENLQVYVVHRPELVELAIQWISANWDLDSGATMVNSLLRNASSHPDSVRISVNWMQDHMDAPGLNLCLGQLLKIGEQGSINLARRWLADNANTKGSHTIAVGLLNQAETFPELAEDVKFWLEKTANRKGLNLVFDAFIKNGIDTEFAIEAHCKFIREREFAADSLHSLPSLLKKFSDRPILHEITREALASDLRNHEFVVILGAFCEAFPDDTNIHALLKQLFDRRVPVVASTRVLSSWLRATDVDHPSWQYTLALRLQSDLRNINQQAFYSVCNAFAYNACKTLALGALNPTSQESLTEALRIGSRSAEGCAASLRECMELWPKEQMSELWKIVLTNDMESFADYREEFLSWITSASSTEYSRVSGLVKKLIGRGMIGNEILRKGS